jgi:repressor of nif and glnA expression
VIKYFIDKVFFRCYGIRQPVTDCLWMGYFLMLQEIEQKTLLMLRILHEAGQPVGALLIARQMSDSGVHLSERAVRYHLKLMDERGLTQLIGRRDGRTITMAGIEELDNARVRDKIGFAISRIESLAFQTTFNPGKREGFLPVNISFFREGRFEAAKEAMRPAFAAGMSVSNLVAIASAGQRLGNMVVPAGMVGLATVCSIVINGVLLKNGVPMDSKFGGILQIKNGKPMRFVEVIYYSGSSLDPSEAYIRGNMTSVQSAVSLGEGKILANFREIPALSLGLVESLIVDLKQAGIDGMLARGMISEPICQIPVDMNKVGMILRGGLNPVACAQEMGIEVENRAMSTVMAYSDMKPFDAT